MKLDKMQSPQGRKYKQRVGRGPGSGSGKTSGTGHGGQKTRSGKGKPRLGFEGGQMPKYRRLPKRGFKNIFAKVYTEVSVAKLEKLDNDTEVTAELLKEKGLINKINDGIRVLGNGELSKKLTVKAAHVTAGAKQKIEKAGGSVEILGQQK